MQPLEILLVEDSTDDILLIREALRSGHVANQLHVVRDGDDAMKFMRNQAAYEDTPRADLVLLDLNLPGKDGREVLEDIKSDPALRAIPVIVLTTSEEERDILHAYNHLANAYVTKPLDLTEFFAAIRLFENFWLTLVRLPTAPKR